MKRILIDYKRLDVALTSLLLETYPNGYGDDDIVAFKNHKGEFIEAVELKTEDAFYLVKISKSLSHFIASMEDVLENDTDETGKDVMEEPELELNLEAEFEDGDID